MWTNDNNALPPCDRPTVTFIDTDGEATAGPVYHRDAEITFLQTMLHVCLSPVRLDAVEIDSAVSCDVASTDCQEARFSLTGLLTTRVTGAVAAQDVGNLCKLDAITQLADFLPKSLRLF